MTWRKALGAIGTCAVIAGVVVAVVLVGIPAERKDYRLRQNPVTGQITAITVSTQPQPDRELSLEEKRQLELVGLRNEVGLLVRGLMAHGASIERLEQAVVQLRAKIRQERRQRARLVRELYRLKQTMKHETAADFPLPSPPPKSVGYFGRMAFGGEGDGGGE